MPCEGPQLYLVSGILHSQEFVRVIVASLRDQASAKLDARRSLLDRFASRGYGLSDIVKDLESTMGDSWNCRILYYIRSTYVVNCRYSWSPLLILLQPR